MVLLGGFVTSVINGCTQSSDGCDGLEGYHTHSVIEITGIESASVYTRAADTGTLVATDQANGTDFSNLVIQVDMSWIEEQHRFRAPSTFLQSLSDWFISPAMACSMPPYHEDYQPAVISIEIHSDSDLNADYLAGEELNEILTITGVSHHDNMSEELADSADPLSARRYWLQAEQQDGEAAVIPDTPSTHIFTVMVSLEDGRVFEIRTPAILLSGV